MSPFFSPGKIAHPQVPIYIAGINPYMCRLAGELCLRLHEKTAKGDWSGMAKEITDEMLAEFAVTGAPEEVPGLLKAKYDGLLDRVAFYQPYHPGQHEARWRKLIEAFQQ